MLAHLKKTKMEPGVEVGLEEIHSPLEELPLQIPHAIQHLDSKLVT